MTINLFKRVMGILGTLSLAALSGAVYMNHFYQMRAMDAARGDSFEFLHKANRIYPLNDETWFELGRRFLESAVSELDDPAGSRESLKAADRNLKKAMAINPFSPFSHYYRGQALHYLTFVDPGAVGPDDPFREFEHAAFLAAHNSEVYYEVGKLMFSRWPELNEKQRARTVEILKIIPLEGRREKIQTLMKIWKLDVMDYGVMKSILPPESPYLRMFADFLGSESLSLPERLSLLAEAEGMKYDWARREFEVGEKQFYNYRFQDALRHFQNSRDTLVGMPFYQDLTGTGRIDPEEWDAFDKDVHLFMAKCLLEDGRGLKEADVYLRYFMEKESRVAVFKDLESYLGSRDFLDLRGAHEMEDIDRLRLRMRLDFKQNRYRESIAKVARIREVLDGAPDEASAARLEILCIIADSYQKLDYLYDAETYYGKALEIDPGNLIILNKFRANAVRLNDHMKIRDIDKRIENLISPKKIVGRFELDRNKSFDLDVRWTGRPVRLILEFEPGPPSAPRPLISVFINGRILWESYMDEKRLSIPLSTRIGSNRILVSVANGKAVLQGISWVADDLT